MKHILKINDSLSKRSFKDSSIFRQALGTVASCLICLCSGLTLGISSVMLPQLREDKSIFYNPDHDTWIASIITLSMIVGSLGSGPILDSYGRKVAHIILGVPFIIGWIVIACSTSTTTILVGRFITGISSGANKAVSLVYIGEIANPQIRAAFLYLPGINTLTGTLISHILGYYIPWKISSTICIAPAVISSVIFLFLRESPLWLITKGRIDEGIEAFRWFRGSGDDSEMELKMVLDRQAKKPKMSTESILTAVCSRAFIKPTLILMVVSLSIQLSGVNILRFYSQDVFKLTFSGNVDPFIFTMATDCIRAVVTVTICILEKFIPRKPAFLTSCLGITIFIVGLVACLMIDCDRMMWITVLCLGMFISFSSVVIAVGWTFVPELLPSSARGLGSGLNSGFSYLSLFVILESTPSIMNSFGVSALYAVFGISTLVCGVILFFLLPETNGKTLQSIEDSYNTKIEKSAS